MSSSRFALAAMWLALGAMPAAAHVTLETQQAPANSTTRATFRVPHGCDGAATMRVTVRLPEGTANALPMPKAGWRLTTVPRPNQPPPAGHGAVPQLAEVIWEGGPLENHHYDEFVIRLRLPDTPGQILYIPVVQDCVGGGQAAWVEIPEPGRRVTDYRMPAPAIRITPRS